MKRKSQIKTEVQPYESEEQNVEPLIEEGVIEENEEQSNKQRRGIVIGQLVNVRAAPDQNANVLAIAQNGTKLDIISNHGEWLKVKITETRHIGYMIKDCIAEV